MDHEQFDILLSAYLDGELTAEEQLRVEQLLASNAEARQLVEELRALRAGLQALPQHRLEPNFAERVLRLAEQESQQGAAKPDNSSVAAVSAPLHDNTGSENGELEPFTRRRFWFNPRGVAWAAVAATIAFIITATNRDVDRREIAKAPDNKAPAKKTEQDFFKRAEPQVTPQLSADPNADKRDADVRDLETTKSAVAKDQITNTPNYSFSNNGAIAGSSSATTTTDAPAPANAASSATQPASDAYAADGILTKKTAPELAREPAPGQALAVPSDVLFVEVRVSPEAAQRGEFDRLLAANAIQLDNRSEGERRQLSVDNKQAQAADDLSKRNRDGVTDGEKAGAKLGVADRAKERDAQLDGPASGLDSGTRAAPSASASVPSQAGGQPKGAVAGEELKGTGEIRLQLEANKNLVAGNAFWFDQADFVPPAELRKLSEQGPVDLVCVEALPQQIESTLAGLQRAPQFFTVAQESLPQAAAAEGKVLQQPADKLERDEFNSADVRQRSQPGGAGFGGGGAGGRADGGGGGGRRGGGQGGAGVQRADRLPQLSKSAGSAELAEKQSAQLANDGQKNSNMNLGRAVRFSVQNEAANSAGKVAAAEKLAESKPELQRSVQEQPRGRAIAPSNVQPPAESKAFNSAGGVAAPMSAPTTPQGVPSATAEKQKLDSKVDSNIRENETAADYSRGVRSFGDKQPAAAADPATAAANPDLRRKVVFVLRVAEPAAAANANSAAVPPAASAAKPTASSPALAPTKAPATAPAGPAK